MVPSLSVKSMVIWTSMALCLGALAQPLDRRLRWLQSEDCYSDSGDDRPEEVLLIDEYDVDFAGFVTLHFERWGLYFVKD